MSRDFFVFQFPTVYNHDDGCSADGNSSLTGEALMVDRGNCTFQQKALEAEHGGASALVMVSNTSDLLEVCVCQCVLI